MLPNGLPNQCATPCRYSLVFLADTIADADVAPAGACPPPPPSGSVAQPFRTIFGPGRPQMAEKPENPWTDVTGLKKKLVGRWWLLSQRPGAVGG